MYPYNHCNTDNQELSISALCHDVASEQGSNPSNTNYNIYGTSSPDMPVLHTSSDKIEHNHKQEKVPRVLTQDEFLLDFLGYDIDAPLPTLTEEEQVEVEARKLNMYLLVLETYQRIQKIIADCEV